MERPARRSAIDRVHELTVSGRDSVGIAVGDRRLEPLRERLHSRAVAHVLEPLASSDPDALLLLSDVWHIREKARVYAGCAMVAKEIPPRRSRLPFPGATTPPPR